MSEMIECTVHARSFRRGLSENTKKTPKLLHPVYTIKQTSNSHRANIQQMHSKYTCTACALIARCLLDDCLMV